MDVTSKETNAVSLEEAMDAEVTRDEACWEIRLHELDPADFFLDASDRTTYRGAEVLEWLGD